jgi:hypothetical protein
MTTMSEPGGALADPNPYKDSATQLIMASKMSCTYSKCYRHRAKISLRLVWVRPYHRNSTSL